MNKAIKMDYGLWIDCGSSLSEDKSLVLAINTWDAGDLSDYSGLEFNSSFFPKCQEMYCRSTIELLLVPQLARMNNNK